MDNADSFPQALRALLFVPLSEHNAKHNIRSASHLSRSDKTLCTIISHGDLHEKNCASLISGPEQPGSIHISYESQSNITQFHECIFVFEYFCIQKNLTKTIIYLQEVALMGLSRHHHPSVSPLCYPSVN